MLLKINIIQVSIYPPCEGSLNWRLTWYNGLRDMSTCLGYSHVLSKKILRIIHKHLGMEEILVVISEVRTSQYIALI